MSKRRINWIDMAKGIGILLVIVGHVTQNRYLGNIIYSFHMPLFFILSGIICFYNNKPIKYKKILIPYFIYSILTYFYWVLIERHLRHQETNVMWQGINIFLEGRRS